VICLWKLWLSSVVERRTSPPKASRNIKGKQVGARLAASQLIFGENAVMRRVWPRTRSGVLMDDPSFRPVNTGSGSLRT
jgi:hypothetical protein